MMDRYEAETRALEIIDCIAGETLVPREIEERR